MPVKPGIRTSVMTQPAPIARDRQADTETVRLAGDERLK
jgi:hypothetical protein